VEKEKKRQKEKEARSAMKGTVGTYNYNGGVSLGQARGYKSGKNLDLQFMQRRHP